jgi:uncharacterized phage protein (TIGR02218 family)
MRAIPPELAADLTGEALTLAHAWIVVRTDGQTYGYTDHDRDATIAGVLCRAGEGLLAGAVENAAALNVDTSAVEGALSSESLTETDLSAGLWDDAQVELWRFNWMAPARAVRLWSGWIGEVRRGPLAFTAELRGLQARLNTPMGRVYSRFCDAEFGDQRCGVALGGWTGAGVVTARLDPRLVEASGLETFAGGVFSRGRIISGDGRRVAVLAHEQAGAIARLVLFEPAPSWLAIGAAFTVVAGCDKRFATCKDRYANSQNFRGFPHLPGNDAVQAGPSAAQPMDGSSRWR